MTETRLTRRGRVAVALVVAAVFAGWLSGARALNAVAAPAAGALAVSWLILSRSESPTVTLSSVDDGFPDQRRRLTATVSGTGLASLALSVPDGVDAETTDRQVTLPHELTYDLALSSRGVHEVGPPTLSLRGPLGLLERDADAAATTDVTVYPRPYAVDDRSVLARFFLDELEAERQEFDRLREYQPGDPLRHVNWKSSAKHDEFLVTEFAPARRDETVTIVATAPRSEVDEMARIAATIAEIAFDGGYSVELATPSGHVPPGQGGQHREHVLRLLARTTPGPTVPVALEEADVEITFAGGELVVRIGAERYTATELLDRIDGAADGPGVESRSAQPEVRP